MRTDEPGGPSREDRSRDLDDIVAEYADRINAGETIRPEDILAEHPALCVEILDQLQAFVSVRQPADGGRELGTLGDYTLRRQIGRGGMGVVYEAWENSMDRRVALKVLPAAVAVDNRALLRFLREARTAGQLAHPSVVPVYALGVKDQTPYYAMELVDGETLAQILRSLKGAEPDAATPFGRKDDLRYFMNIAESFAEVAEGLQHAHSKGVVHRDIKPSNLILDRAANPAGGGFPGCAPGRLRILDFGLAHLEGQASLTLSGDLVGTVLYMSPEQARRRKDPVDARSDVYSLGATLYELLASRPPFLGRDHQETLSQIIEKEPVRPAELNPRVPRDLETVVLKCLEKDRMDRYRTAEALAQDLRRFVRGDPVEARAHPRWERIARRIWKQRLKIIVASLLLLLLAAVVVLLVQVWWDGYRQRRADYAPAVNAAVQMVYFGGSSARMGLERGRRFDPGGFFVGEEEPAGSASPLRQAVEKLERLALDVPERPDAWYHKARGLLLLGRDEEALVALDRAIAADPEFVPAFILKAAIFEKQREEDLAHGELERAERAAVSEWARDLIAAYRAVEALDWEAAAQSFGRVVDGETLEIARGGRERYVGSLAETHISRGVAHFKRREFTTAGMDFWVAKAFWRDALDPILLLGETLILDGKKETAEEILDAFYRRTERKDESALAISVRLFYLGQHERGLRWADRVQDEVVRTRARMAHLYLMWRSAEATLEAREVPAGMDDARFCGNLALACVRQKELAAARSLFLRAVRLEPRNALMWRALGALSTAAGDFDAAREQFERSLSFTEVPPTQFYLAEALFIMGDFQGAEAQFRRAAAIFSRWGFPDIRIHGAIGDLVVGRNHGALLEHMGKPREALEEYLKVLDGLPGEMWIHERLASLLRSEVSAEFWAAVDAWIEPARNGPPPPGASSDATPPDPPWCAAAALALAHHPTAPDAGKALEHARLAVEMTRGNHAGLLATLAEVEEACGDLPAAVAALERAAALPEADVSLAAALASSRRRLAPGLASFATLDAFIGDGGVEILVPEDAEWAFLRGLASPPEGLEWTRADFDDSGWERGKSPLGYGLAYFCSTRIDGMAGAYPCVYVRKLFDAADPGAFRELRLEVWADNGFVAYLNGAEVARARLETPDDEKIFAFSPVHGQPHARPLPYAVRIDASRLSAGANCLALRGVNHS
ncbi:MAG: protein kinase, partial [Planctomycetes bacterium]|nr:protein kinase [Planctomycetota bacterium]